MKMEPRRNYDGNVEYLMASTPEIERQRCPSFGNLRIVS
jgi:hypothetical protein